MLMLIAVLALQTPSPGVTIPASEYADLVRASETLSAINAGETWTPDLASKIDALTRATVAAASATTAAMAAQYAADNPATMASIAAAAMGDASAYTRDLQNLCDITRAADAGKMVEATAQDLGYANARLAMLTAEPTPETGDARKWRQIALALAARLKEDSQASLESSRFEQNVLRPRIDEACASVAP